MSDFIQFPHNIVELLTARSKHDEAFTYVAIRNEIKDSSRTASYSQIDLAELLHVTDKTIYNYIHRLKETQLLTVKEKKQGTKEYPYNVYLFPELTDNYSMVLPTFIADTELSPKLKGILLFAKANCECGTNHLIFQSRTGDLAEKLGVGKNQVNGYLSELESKGYIRFIGKTLIITSSHFPLSITNDYDNIIYSLIYKFCLFKGIVPPLKDKQAIAWLETKYADNYKQFVADLKKKCVALPNTVHLNYFCQALLNKTPIKKKTTTTFIM